MMSSFATDAVALVARICSVMDMEWHGLWAWYYTRRIQYCKYMDVLVIRQAFFTGHVVQLVLFHSKESEDSEEKLNT